MDRIGLLSILIPARLPLEKWCIGKAKTVDHLLEEINGGETELIVVGDKLLRTVRVVALTVTYHDDQNKLVLVEEKQVFRNGRERIRNLESSLGEKMTVGELPEQAARRALAEELQITGDENEFTFDFMGENFKGPEESPSYPGLNTRYQFFAFSVDLPPRMFKPEGYIEEQDDKTTYFVWK